MGREAVTIPQMSKNMPYTVVMPSGGRPTTAQRPELGERIATARERKGMSQYELAELLGVHQQSIAAWERKVSTIRSDTLVKLAQALSVSADELLGLENPSHRGPAGKLKKAFDQASTLPKRRQQRVVEMIEDMVAAQEAQAS